MAAWTEMKDIFDIFLHCMNFKMVPRIFSPKPVLKAIDKSAIFTALMVTRSFFSPFLQFNYAQSYFEWDKIHSSCEENESMTKYFKENLRSRCKSSAALLITCIGLTSGNDKVL